VIYKNIYIYIAFFLNQLSRMRTSKQSTATLLYEVSNYGTEQVFIEWNDFFYILLLYTS
jgi:hypothetical protein